MTTKATPFPTKPTRSLLDADTMMINRYGITYQAQITDLASTAKDDDLLIVNRFGSTYQVRYADVLDQCLETDMFIVNRFGKSYHATLAEIRGTLATDVTFTCTITTGGKSFNKGSASDDNPWCSSPQSGSVKGGQLRATVTAPSTAAYYFQNGVFYLNNEWIMVCGSTGDTGFKNDWRKDYDYMYDPPRVSWLVCHWYYLGEESKGLSAVGVKNIGPGGDQYNWNQGSTQHDDSGRYGNSGRGGYGCPPGNGGKGRSPGGDSGGGYAGSSQTRPRAENTGDTWNGITVTGASHNKVNSGGTHISKDGVTLSGPGVIGDLIA